MKFTTFLCNLNLKENTKTCQWRSYSYPVQNGQHCLFILCIIERLSLLNQIVFIAIDLLSLVNLYCCRLTYFITIPLLSTTIYSLLLFNNGELLKDCCRSQINFAVEKTETIVEFGLIVFIKP